MDENIGGGELLSFVDAEGYSWGIEFLVKKTSRNLTGWLGYSFMHTRKRKNAVSGWYPPKYDRTPQI
ncbi:MAG: hypothetical protein U5N26_02965 [Candidatus Marinimicrobia bacterium]|nr:hypothetical protein [Candidatus Neomarinimicrobiota bacterium]